jgi:DNA-binding NtrC family response regulator
MSVEAPRILVVDDEANQRSALAAMLGSWGYASAQAGDGLEALEKLESFDADVLITDLMMPRLDGAGLLKKLRERSRAPAAIVLTAFGNLETAVAMVHDLGAFWFLEKPLQPAALKLLLERAVKIRTLEDRGERLERELSRQGVLAGLVGGSARMQQVFTQLRQVAPTRATVLVTGESGTGKELAARAVHDLSPRRAGPFVALNCAALPESLIESELFGHEKGAFTGALERRRGCFEIAHGGTLLLDEIGEMPLATQSKLLRVLEDRKVRRLGAPAETAVDVRVVVSTNRVLPVMVRDGRFREDLYYRVAVFEVALPPLRDRLEDLPALCEALVRDLNERHQCRVTGMDASTLEALTARPWPGNVRELRNVIERAVILAGDGPLLPEHLPGLPGASAPRPRPETLAGAVTIQVGTTVDQAERLLIEKTLEHTRQNRTRAAALLGISQKTLFNKLRDYGAGGA